jgi:hypothetical protein
LTRCVQAAYAKYTLGLDKILGEKKVQLNEERDLTLQEAALTEA